MFASSFLKNKTQRPSFSPERSLGWRRRQEQTSAQQFTDMQIEYPKTASRNVPVMDEPEVPEEVVEANRDILNFFVKQSKTTSITSLLDDFETFFINHDPNEIPQSLNHSVYQLLVYNCTSDFIYLLNRCSFLIVNLCLKNKQTKNIEKLIGLFQERSHLASNASLATRKFRDWVDSYMSSRQYKILELFSPNSKFHQKSWHDRYIRLTLLSQTFDIDIPIEQRQACQFLYQFLQNRYKFQLVMYLTKGGEAAENKAKAKVANPTLIHPSTLKLIHKVVVKRGEGYPQMAEAFLEQHEHDIYGDFKKALVEHLLASIGGDRRLKWLPKKLEQHLDELYSEKKFCFCGPPPHYKNL